MVLGAKVKRGVSGDFAFGKCLELRLWVMAKKDSVMGKIDPFGYCRKGVHQG